MHGLKQIRALFAEGEDITARVCANAAAPASERKHLDTFCRAFSIRMSRYVWSLSRGMVRCQRLILAEPEPVQRVASGGLFAPTALSWPSSACARTHRRAPHSPARS